MQLPGAKAIQHERERRYAASLRVFFEELGRPQWPAWPTDRDGDYHAWVRANWSIPASDVYDVLTMMTRELESARLRVLGQDLLDLGDNVEAIRLRIAEDGLDVWEEGALLDWRAWIADNWRADLAEGLERALGSATTSLGWVGDHRERMRQHERERVAQKERLMRLNLSAEEMQPYLELRVCGIRGRYRLLQSVMEKKLGITAADIDAP